VARETARGIINLLASSIGDSLVLTTSHVQRAAIVDVVARTLENQLQRCAQVVVLAHSQGAAVSHAALRACALGRSQRNIDLARVHLVTVGSGLQKLTDLRYGIRHHSNTEFVATYMAAVLGIGGASYLVANFHGRGIACLLMSAIMVGALIAIDYQMASPRDPALRQRWRFVERLRFVLLSTVLGAVPAAFATYAMCEDTFPNSWGGILAAASAFSLGLGAGATFIGNYGGLRRDLIAEKQAAAAKSINRRTLGAARATQWFEDSLAIEGLGSWLDLHASGDPVPNGAPLGAAESGSVVTREVINQRSFLADHNSYWQNATQVIAPIVDRILAHSDSVSRRVLPGRAEEARIAPTRLLITIRWIFFGLALALASWEPFLGGAKDGVLDGLKSVMPAEFHGAIRWTWTRAILGAAYPFLSYFVSRSAIRAWIRARENHVMTGKGLSRTKTLVGFGTPLLLIAGMLVALFSEYGGEVWVGAIQAWSWLVLLKA